MTAQPAQVTLSAGHERAPVALLDAVRGTRASQPGVVITVTVDPPHDLVWLWRLYQAGASTVSIDVGSLDQDVRDRHMPEIADIPLRRYDAAWSEAVRLFGRGRVMTRMRLGLGEDATLAVRGSERLLAMGVLPVLDPVGSRVPEQREALNGFLTGCPTCGTLTPVLP